ncbi:substrate-binding domain-containing protein [Glycomyces harbinensis]|uniref:LacI family transcriptional regulator/LacI family transcriptional regulator, xylobiose transport system transcriptional regulator n=1 Tax=Glycomyces harbinensis TaxID=58114 RepID=A0A1G6QUN3_9ACTN|nr:substrate-binding domain-containing protein [Glycomyces harbinensis]SDC95406.1 LacI family transcriptional regulator/LacI family transcriptional regulator, xylobiose transport system transcriptional regulator [Glycomyces harbinensis]
MTPTPESEPEGPLTIAQLAALAGVSTATVSKVVNGRSDVAAATREQIEGLIRSRGYRRQRRPAKSAALIDVVFHELRGLYPVEILNGVDEVAREHRLGVVVSEMGGRHTPGQGWLEDVLARRPLGVLSVFSGLAAEQSERLYSRDIPLVLVDPTGDPDHDAPAVGAGNWNGGLAAARHLVGLGHRRIAVVTGPDHMESSRARLDGFRAGLDLAGVPLDPALERHGDFMIEGGLEHARAMLGLDDPPTAVFACNDGSAIGVYHAAAEAGLRIPQDLSVVGFDDLPKAKWTIPPLTTIHQPLKEMAAAAARMVVALAAGEPLPQPRVQLATELVVRQSTAPPRAER